MKYETQFLIYFLLITVGIIAAFLVILFYSQSIPTLTGSIQFLALCSPYLILFYYYRKAKIEKRENLIVLRNRLKFIINHIHNNVRIINEEPIEKGGKATLSGLRYYVTYSVEKMSFQENILSYINRLRDFGPKLLYKLKCEIYGLKDDSLRLFEKYLVGPMGIKEISEVKKIDITDNKDKINTILTDGYFNYNISYSY